jgi:hypothetical protein
MCDQCQKTEKELKEAKKLLVLIKARSMVIAINAVSELDAGNVPRGRWEWLGARLKTANDILEILNERPIEMRPRVAKFFDGLFKVEKRAGFKRGRLTRVAKFFDGLFKGFGL